MMAANYRHIGGGVNRLGRHYSRFSGFWPMAPVVDQSLALRKSQNRESNRRRRARVEPCRSTSGPNGRKRRDLAVRDGTRESRQSIPAAAVLRIRAEVRFWVNLRKTAAELATHW